MAALFLAVLAVAVAGASAQFFGGATSVGTASAGLAVQWLSASKLAVPAYVSIGSGAGIKAFTANTLCLAASDDPMTSQQDAAAGKKFTVPLTLSAYSFLVSGSNGVQLKGSEVASIYLGTIKMWSDSALKGRVGSMAGAIVPVARSDASGTTFLITKYFSASKKGFPQQFVGFGPFTYGNGAVVAKAGSGGVASFVLGNKAAIGYAQTGAGVIQYANFEVAVTNPAGQYILATRALPTQSIPRSLPANDKSWAGVSLVYVRGDQTYPIASFVFGFVRPVAACSNYGKFVKPFLKYVFSTVNGGQSLVGAQFFTALPANILAKNNAIVASLKP